MPRYAALVLVVMSPSWVFADPPSSDQINQWIRDLDHPRYRVRDVATLKLQQAGVSAVPALLEPAKAGNPEISGRVMKILGDMAEGREQPTELAARDALRQLAAETGSISGIARGILERRRNDYVVRMEACGVTISRLDHRVLRIHLDEVTAADMANVLPMLREFPETEYLSATTKAFDDQAAKHLATLRDYPESGLACKPSHMRHLRHS